MNREQVVEILEKYGESYWEGAEHAIGWIFPGKFANIAKEIVALHDKEVSNMFIKAGQVIGSLMASQEGIERRRLP